MRDNSAKADTCINKVPMPIKKLPESQMEHWECIEALGAYIRAIKYVAECDGIESDPVIQSEILFAKKLLSDIVLSTAALFDSNIDGASDYAYGAEGETARIKKGFKDNDYSFVQENKDYSEWQMRYFGKWM